MYLYCLIAVGFVMTNYLQPPLKYDVYATHKAVGFTVLVLILVRFFLRVFTSVPPMLKELSVLERFASANLAMQKGLIISLWGRWDTGLSLKHCRSLGSSYTQRAKFYPKRPKQILLALWLFKNQTVPAEGLEPPKNM